MSLLYVSSSEVIQTPSASIICRFSVLSWLPLLPRTLQRGPAILLQPHAFSAVNFLWLEHSFLCPWGHWGNCLAPALSLLSIFLHVELYRLQGLERWNGVWSCPLLFSDLLTTASSHTVGAAPIRYQLRQSLSHSFIALPLLVSGGEGCFLQFHSSECHLCHPGHWGYYTSNSGSGNVILMDEIPAPPTTDSSPWTPRATLGMSLFTNILY